MAEVIYPDVIGIIRDWLLDHLDVPVVIAMTKQDEAQKRHTEFVRLHLFGGAEQTVVSGRPLVGVEGWGETNPDAHDLAQEALATLRHLPGERGPVYKLNVVSLPGALPDDLSGAPRFTFMVEPHLRAETHTLAGS